MSIFKSRKEFPTALFIVASLLSLVALPILLVFLKLTVIDQEKTVLDNVYADYTVKETGDPFITRVPTMQDIIKSPVLSPNDPIIGDTKAPVVIVEYSDYRCEFCQKQEAVLKKIIDEYKGKVALVWKDYPENNDFSSTWLANIAGRCAQAQGKFWDMHGILFKNSNNVSLEKFSDLASSIGLDKEKFSTCLNDIAPRRQIKNNIVEADALKITGVPFIYVNNEEIMGEISYEELKMLIDSKLKK